MANKNRKNKKETGLIAQAKVVNNVALSVGEELVDLTLKGAETSQRVFGKVVEGGVTLFGMQQKFALDTLEKLVTNDQVKKMVQLPANYFNRFLNTAEEKVADLREDTVEVLDEVKSVIKKKKPTAKKVKRAKKAITAKRPALRKVTRVATTKVQKIVIEKDDLTKIKGIGPKAAGILTKAGYGSFIMVANANKAELEAVLAKAGTRFMRLNPAPWIKQAKKLAK